MRWPRLARRRTAPAPQPLTFHHEMRTVATKDGPMTVRMPVLDQENDLNAVPTDAAGLVRALRSPHTLARYFGDPALRRQFVEAYAVEHAKVAERHARDEET